MSSQLFALRLVFAMSPVVRWCLQVYLSRFVEVAELVGITTQGLSFEFRSDEPVMDGPGALGCVKRSITG